MHKVKLKNVKNISPGTYGNFPSDFYYFTEPVRQHQVSHLSNIFLSLLSD